MLYFNLVLYVFLGVVWNLKRKFLFVYWLIIFFIFLIIFRYNLDLFLKLFDEYLLLCLLIIELKKVWISNFCVIDILILLKLVVIVFLVVFV